MTSRFFYQFSVNALKYRKQRLLLAFGALAVAAALATVMFGIYASVAGRIRDEFRGYGANLVAAGANGGTVPLALAAAAEKLGAPAAPVLITSASVASQMVAVVGLDPARVVAMHSYWHVDGRAELSAGSCLAGESLGLQVGASVTIAGKPCVVKGVVSTGGPEDRELMVDFDTASAIAGLHDVASAVEIQAPGDRMESVRTALASQFPAADVRTVRAIAGTETNVIVKMRAAMLLLTLVILVITTLCVTSNFSELVIERSKEIGIMKALGGVESRIAKFFVSESVALAAMATVTGYVAGVFGVAMIGHEVFGGVFKLQADGLVFAGVAGVMLLVAAVATAIATARIWSIEPAVILRGE